jgi:hypothetical protein
METHRERFLRRHGLPESASLSLAVISRLSGVPERYLQEVYNRGIGAWRTNIESVRLKKDFSKNPDVSRYPRSARLGKEMWAMARVYSFVDKGKTYHTADSDIAKRLK